MPDGVYDLRVRVTSGFGPGAWATTFAATLAGEEIPSCGDAGGRPNHSPQFSEGASASRDLPENAVRGQGVGIPVQASDPDGDKVAYRLSGPDAGSFAIDARSGQMRTSVSFQGSGAQNKHRVIVSASDGRHASGRGGNDGDDARIEVTITDAAATPEPTPTPQQQILEPAPTPEPQPAAAGPPTPGQREPYNIRVVPGDGSLTVSWSVAPRQGVADDAIRHALRWSQTPGVWNNPRDPHNVGPNDGVTVEGGVTTYTIPGLQNGVVTGVHLRSYTGEEDHSETAASSSKWVKVKGAETTPQAPPQPKTYSVTATASAAEGSDATLTVTLSENAPDGGAAFTVRAGFQNGAGKAEQADVGSVPQTVTVAAGARTASLAVPLAPDALTEGDETFTVTLTPPASWTEASLGAGTATVTITDVAPQPEPQQQEPATPEKPGPVVNLQVSLTTDGVTVSWEAPQSGGAPNRYVVRLTPAAGGKDKVKEPKATKTGVTFGSVAAGATYQVKVRAQNKAGKGEAVKASVTVPELPGAPANLQLLAEADRITATWEAPQSGGTPAGYLLNVKNTDSGEDEYHSVGASETTATFGGLEAGGAYRVWVRAVNAGGKGERVRANITLPAEGGVQGGQTTPRAARQQTQAQEQAQTQERQSTPTPTPTPTPVASPLTTATATAASIPTLTPTPVASPLTAPALTAAAGGESAIELSWASVAGAVRYELRVWWDPLPAWEPLGETDRTSYTHSGLTAGRAYYYTIRVVNAAGETSDWQQDFASATVAD